MRTLLLFLVLFTPCGCKNKLPIAASTTGENVNLFLPENDNHKSSNFIQHVSSNYLLTNDQFKSCFYSSAGHSFGCIALTKSNLGYSVPLNGRNIMLFSFVDDDDLFKSRVDSIQSSGVTINMGNIFISKKVETKGIDTLLTYKFDKETLFSHMPFISGMTISSKSGIVAVDYFNGYESIRSVMCSSQKN